MNPEVFYRLGLARGHALRARDELARLRTETLRTGRRGLREELRKADRLAEGIDRLAGEVAKGDVEIALREPA